jgi:UTP--glucose-1-phosphate uridylyltransferase
MITKALITAAGRGTRFLPVVKGYAKELVPILNKPQIQYLVEEAIAAGITEICIVHRHGEKSLRDYFKPSPDWESYLRKIGKLNHLDSLKTIHQKLKTLKLIPQPRHLHYGNASPILAAKSFIGTDPFVLMFGDDLIIEKESGRYLKKMISTYEKYSPAIVVSVKDVGPEEISRYGSAKYISDPEYPNRITGMFEKLPAATAPSFFGQGGRFIVNGAKIYPILAKQSLSRDRELWFADAVNTLAATDIVITEATDKESDWMTTGDPLRWLKANITVALNDQNLGPKIKSFLKKI